MPEEIAELVNKRIYANTLLTEKKPPDAHKKEKNVIDSPPFPKQKIILCDTSEFNPWCTRSPVRRSPFNVYSALLSVYLAEKALFIEMKTYLEPSDVSLMQQVANCQRDKLLIRLLFRLGCRVSELLSVRISDIDFQHGNITILHLKRV